MIQETGPSNGNGSDGATNGDGRLLPEVARWAVIHTKARSEKVLAEFLARRSVHHYLPLRVSKRRYGKRVRETRLPLFPSYVFYDHAAIEWQRIYDSNRVARVLVPDDSRELDRDLENIARALKVEPSMQAARTIARGTPVEVVLGPFQGVVGEMMRYQNFCKLVLRVHYTGFAAELSIDEDFVKVIVP